MIVTPLRVAAFGLLATCAVPFAQSQPQPPAAGDAASENRRAFNDCFRCHGNGPNEDDVRSGADKLLTLRESKKWRDEDLHALAFAALSKPLGERMGMLLYGDKDVTRRTECLACHATNITAAAGRGSEVAHYYRKDGVSCEACHGLAQVGEEKRKWFDDHRDPSWRKVTPDVKKSKGLLNLRNPEVRAGVCSSCHVGSAAEGKFVTHAMYAAGHPPLPPLEVMTYSRDEPSHAKPPDKNEYINSLNADDAWKLFHYRKGETSARQVAVGAAVGFREAMNTLATKAQDAEAGKGESPILDFALFDCAACHHDLAVPSWRQDGRTIPGRPVPRTGPTALLRTLARQAGDGDVDAKFAALSKACDARPFGTPREIAAAARALEAWSGGLAKKLDDARYDDATTTKLLRDVAETARRKDGRAMDYDDAQQLLWAFTAFREGGLPPAAEAEVKKIAGSDKMLLDRLTTPGQRKLIFEVLPERQKRVSDYQPDAFQKAFDCIAGALGTAGR